MANKRIDELTAATPLVADFLPATPAGGPSTKATVSQVVAAGLNQPNSAASGAGANLTIKAADGVTSGAGGSIYITPGAQAATGGKGQIILDGGVVLGMVGTGNIALCTGLPSTTASTYNTIIGYSSMPNLTTASENVLIGGIGVALTTGSQNVVIGNSSGTGTTSSNNVIIGRASSLSNTTGGNNTAIGWYAQYANTTGEFNVSIGRDAGRTATTPNSCTYLGASSDGTANSTQEMAIGYGCGGEGSYTVTIGNSSTVQQHLWATRYIKTEGSMAFASSTPTALAINTDNLVLTGSAFQRLSASAAVDLTGIAPPTGGAHVDGRSIKLVNIGTNTITLRHQLTSTAPNQLYTSTGASVSLAAGQIANCIYDTAITKWRVWVAA